MNRQITLPASAEEQVNENQPNPAAPKRQHAEQEQLLHELQEERLQAKALAETLEEQVAKRTEQIGAQWLPALSLAEQQERSRISRILHDDLQQSLYGLLIRLNLLKDEVEGPAPVSQIEDITNRVNQAIDITRTLVAELRPPLLQAEGLP